MSDTVLDRRTEIIPETGEPEAAHIIKVEPGEDASVKVMDARLNGTAVEALCGVVFVPQKDPTKLPLCEGCKAMYDAYKSFNEGLSDSPRMS